MVYSRILFAGNILSKHKASKGVSEKIVDIFSNEVPIRAVSDKSNKIFRFADIFWVCLTHNYDILVADTYSGQALTIARLASLVAKIRGKKIILVLRGGMLPEFYAKNKSLVNSILQRSNQIITPSIYLYNSFNEFGYKVEYFPNFIDTSVFYERKVERKPYSLLWVRAFRNIYNPWLAVESLANVLKNYPQATLMMVGPDDGLLDETKKLAKQLGVLDKITFAGPIKNTELPILYSSCAVYLNTTSYESFGMAVMEAVACGIPVVSTAVGEIPLLWQDDEEILLISDFEAKSMSEKIGELFANPAKCQSIVSNAKLKVSAYSLNQIKGRWLKLFQATK